jgi:hypothetical protein
MAVTVIMRKFRSAGIIISAVPGSCVPMTDNTKLKLISRIDVSIKLKSPLDTSYFINTSV